MSEEGAEAGSEPDPEAGIRPDRDAPSRGGRRVLPYRIVDAFTDRAFSGNPAAVLLPPDLAMRGLPGAHPPENPRPGAAHSSRGTPRADPASLPDATLLAIAGEMNLSETAFPSAPGEGGLRRLRWFTPATEVTLCGHATLAAAHALLEEGAEPPLRFDSLSGPLTVHREEDARLRLDFPADPPRSLEAPEGLMEALGLPAETPFLTGGRCAIVPVDDEEELRAVAPAMEALGGVRLPPGVMGVSVTAPGAGGRVDFASRFFGPWVGVPEDPVTGMAHTVLGPYWGMRLGKEELEARQRSPRGGALKVRVMGDRVHLVGQAVTVARGELLVPPDGV